MRPITIISYSPDGKSEKIAEILAKQLSSEHCVIDLTDPALRHSNHFFSKGDLLIFTAPACLGRLPVVEGGIFDHIYANDTPGIFLATFAGSSYGDVLLEMAQIAEDRGIVGIGALALPSQTNKNGKRNELNKLKLFADSMKQIIPRIESDPAYFEHYSLTINGNFPYRTYETAGISQSSFLPNGDIFCMSPRFC